MTSLVTVIPAYNAEAHLPETLEALAAQQLRADRVIVLDDGSTDRTPEIVRSFRRLPVEYVRNERNLGLFPNHNRALDYAAEADYLHILHANDLIHPAFYARLVPLLEDCPGAGMAFSRYAVISESGSLLDAGRFPRHPGVRVLSGRELLVDLSELKSLLIDAALLKTDRRPPPCRFRLDLPHLGDVMFHAEWAVASQRIACVNEALCSFRQHHVGATRTNVKHLGAWVTDEWRVMQAVAELIPESPAARWIRRQRLRCLFAARSHVKIAQTRQDAPEFARQIGTATRARTGNVAWGLGWLAVRARDAMRAVVGSRAPI